MAVLHVRNAAGTPQKQVICASDCYWWWKMDPLWQPQAQKTICETRPTSQINGKAEYPLCKVNALYLVGSEGCAVLWAAKTGWNHQWRTLPNTINPFEESNGRKTPGICDQTRGNNFPSTTLGPMLLFRLRTIRKTVDGKFYPTRLIAQTLPLLTTICSGQCRTPSLEYGSHQNRVSKIDLIHSWPPSRRSSFGMNSQIARNMGKNHSFRWAILWIILFYMFFVNKHLNFKKGRTN